MWNLLSNKGTRSKCPHTCYLCHRQIRKNELHWYRSGHRKRKLVQMRMHLACEYVTREWSELDWQFSEKGDLFLINQSRHLKRFYESLKPAST